MQSHHYTPPRYRAIMGTTGHPQIFDSHEGAYCKLRRVSLSAAHHTAAEWNAGALTPAEARVIGVHFLIAACWADSPEGTNPRPTTKALETAQTLAREFVEAIGLPLFRACLEAYEAEGLHPDCYGDACAAFGHDLHLTLGGHGVGFWDRSALAWDHNAEECERLGLKTGQTIGEKITEACHASRWRDNHTQEFYRGWLHFREPLRLKK